ncbi:MAG: hypothetical protein ACP5G1_03120 [Nanopusillaceae archaeon]
MEKNMIEYKDQYVVIKLFEKILYDVSREYVPKKVAEDFINYMLNLEVKWDIKKELLRKIIELNIIGSNLYKKQKLKIEDVLNIIYKLLDETFNLYKQARGINLTPQGINIIKEFMKSSIQHISNEKLRTYLSILLD